MSYNTETGLYEGYIYCIENKLNHKKYIGQTSKTISERFNEHKWDAMNRDDDGMAIHRAMKKYGLDNFMIIELEKLSCANKQDLYNDLDLLEMSYIERYCTMVPKGYNVTRGGTTKSPLCEKEVYCFKKNGEFVQRFCSIAEAERTLNICHGKISMVLSGSSGRHTAGGFLWSYTNEPPVYEPKHSGSPKLSVAQMTIDGNVIHIFSSALEAASELNLQNTLISACCHGRRKSTGGYRWAFV